jgi:lipoprotein-anchoring transpeptidase ErfK/SrfK
VAIAGVVVLLVSGCASQVAPKPVTTTPTPAPPAQVTITPSGNAVAIDSPVTVQVAGGTLSGVVLEENGVPQAVTWSHQKGEWSYAGGLAPGCSYEVTAQAFNQSQTTLSNVQGSFTTGDTGAQRLLTSVYGITQGQVVGVGAVIQLRFNTSIPADLQAGVEEHITVTSQPAQVGGWHWFDASTLDFRPQNYWISGTTVSIQANLLGVPAGGDYWGLGDWTESFSVGPQHITVIDTTTHQMQVSSGGSVVYTFPVSTGKSGYLTIGGTLIVWYKSPVVLMDSCSTFHTPAACDPGGGAYYHENVYQDTAISTDGYFIHAAPWDCYYAGDRSTPGGCGTINRSFGCVELSPANAATFYGFSQVGDVVQVQGSALAGSFTDDEGDWNLPFSAFTLPTVSATPTPTPTAS